MLSLGPGSSCDVCFDRFGEDSKAPCSIECGHVFCHGCINQIQLPHLCPLCRKPFNIDLCTKLHLDIDAVGLKPPLPPASQCSAADLKEAQRFQQAISGIAESGISEANLRQLLQECQTFLSTQPRTLHRDLKASTRMVTYLCEVKTSMRAHKLQAEQLTEQIAQVNQEKANLRKQLADLDELRKYEKETSRAVETSLREHCDQAVNCYKSSIELCNKVSKQNQSLKRQLELVTLAWTGREDEDKAVGGMGLTTTNLEFDQSDLEGVAIQDPNHSFLISPLPQFTSALPSMFEGFTPLPELAEDEGEQESSEEELPTPETLQDHLMRRTLESKRASMPIPVPSQDGRKFLQEPSGLSRTAPYLEHRRARSSSSPSRPTSRSQSPFDSGRASPSTPPASSSQNLSQYSSEQSSSRDPYSLNPPATNVRRLHELLADSSPSSSLPNMTSSHFPPSLTHRDSYGRIGRNSPPPVRTGSANSNKIPLPNVDSGSHLSASLQAHNSPAPSTSPHGHRTGMSSASAEAKKFEEERRMRRAKERQQLSSEYDRPNVDTADRDDRRSSGAGMSSASQAARRDQPQYSNLLSPSNGKSTTSSTSSRRATVGGASGTHGWSGSSLPSQDQGSGHQQPQPRYPGSKPPKPTVLPSDPTGIYA